MSRHQDKEKKAKAGQSKGKKLLVGLSCLAASAMMNGQAAQAQNANCFQTLNFGSILACAGAGTVTVDPTGARSTGGAACLQASGPSSRGRCLLIGSFFPVRPMTVTITTPTVNITNGTTNMSVNNFDLNTPGNGVSTTVTAFITVVDIGGTLNVAANQAAGTYSGAASIVVNFQ